MNNLLIQSIQSLTHISDNDYAANFEAFLKDKPAGKPFCFWFGSNEPHRAYEFRAGATKGGKSISDIDKVFGFWPDNDTVRNDMLDYAFQIEYFDSHLGKTLKILEEKGLLENTIVVVTSDNGMPFPRVKGNAYELSNHLPLAIMCPKGIKNPGRMVDDFISFTDFAPTFLDLAGISEKQSGMQKLEGRSLRPVFDETQKGKFREFMVIGKERTDLGRPDDQGYPIRGIVTNEFLYLRNYHPERWPAGNPETGYMDCDGSPTKTFLLNERRAKGKSNYWDLNFGKLQTEQLFRASSDRECMENLAENPSYAAVKGDLIKQMTKKLKKDGDPCMFGKGDVFDTYPYSENTRNFHNRFMSGEKLKAGWIEPTDIEKESLE